MSKKSNADRSSVSRRRFLGSVAAGATLPSAVQQAAAAATGIAGWDAITDVVVVGSGAGALSAAIAASQLGDKVIVLEKSTVAGGTTAKSTGGIWAPNSHLLRAQGTVDKREDAIRYMVRLSFPEHYDPEHLQFGATEAGYALIATFYDEVCAHRRVAGQSRCAQRNEHHRAPERVDARLLRTPTRMSRNQWSDHVSDERRWILWRWCGNDPWSRPCGRHARRLDRTGATGWCCHPRCIWSGCWRDR